MKHTISVEHAEGFDRYREERSEDYAHEAGFDAFMTGAIFAAFVDQIAGNEASHVEGCSITEHRKLMQHANALNQWGAYPMLHLDRPDGRSDLL